MIELKGKYNNAVIFSDRPDYEAISQIKQMLDVEAFAGSSIKIMPDYHAGAGCVIGFTATGMKNIVPNLIGVDIGCGMLGLNLGNGVDISLEKLDDVIRRNVPSGFDVHDKEVKGSCFDELYDHLYCAEMLKNVDRLRRSQGTLGGGNHFIELNWSDESGYWLVIHTGSRNIGKQVAEYWQSVAVKNVGGYRTEMQENLKEIAPAEREAYVKFMKKKLIVPKGLEYLGLEDSVKYINDMKYCQHFATKNRATIANLILKEFRFNPVFIVETVHNYIDVNMNYIRKGAISATEGEICIIPMNMRDGSLICVGKGNPYWNCSAPHGAGRLMSRSAAKQAISLEEYKDSMQGIFSTSVNESTIDESPMAYKPMEEIISNIANTVEVREVIKPVYNFKAS